MYKVLTLNKISPVGLSHFDSAKYSYSDSEKNPDAVIVRSASMLDMEIPSSVLAIARAGAGYNNIPVEKCTVNGICVFNTPGANANAVKELTICGLLLASRKIAAGIKWAETIKDEDDFSKKVEKGKSQFVGPEIKGKTLGVIGLGAIGVLVANAAASLGMNIVGYDPYLSEKSKNSLVDSAEIADNLDDVFKKSDYITIHSPLNDSTKNTVCAKTLALAKDGVRILNFARGGLVNTSDIISAVKSGKAAAYVTDFGTGEMIGVDGITVLPHLGASTPESEENCAVMAVNQISDYIDNGNIVNSVNLPKISKARNGSRITAIVEGDAESVLNVIGDLGINISDAAAAQRNDFGYIIIDSADESDLDKVSKTDGVVKARFIG